MMRVGTDKKGGGKLGRYLLEGKVIFEEKFPKKYEILVIWGHRFSEITINQKNSLIKNLFIQILALYFSDFFSFWNVFAWQG